MVIPAAYPDTPEPRRTEIVDGFAEPPQAGYALIALIYQSSGGSEYCDGVPMRRFF